jgi:hypothetical protein
VPQSDDKSRGINAREASKLRAILGSEPSSGYAFHDAGRVEKVRPGPGRPPERAPSQVAGQGPGAGGFQQTLVGITVQEVLAARQSARPADATQEAANDQGRLGSSASWPPLPQVPTELVGAVEPEVPTSGLQVAESAPRAASAASVASSTPSVGMVGGAIWQAMPSVVDTAAALEPSPARADSTPPQLALEPAAPSPRDSRPNAWRGSLGELEAAASAYGDPRLQKYEPLVQRTAWEQLHGELSREPELSPALELLRIIARRETLPNDERQAAAVLSQDAIATLARLLQIPEASPTALLLGKRLLRKNPGSMRERSPGTGLSASMLLAGIAVGAGIGWLVTRLIL